MSIDTEITEPCERCGELFVGEEAIKDYLRDEGQLRVCPSCVTPLRVVCSWCQTVIREGRHPPSHGLCLSCEEKLLEEEGLR